MERAASEARLATIPWHALAGLGPLLDAPLAEVLAGAPAERVVARLLRAHQDDFTDEQRRTVAEALFGVGLWRRRLAAGGSPSPRAMLVRLARDLGGAADAARWLAVEATPLPAPRTLGDRFSLPEWLANELRAAAGDEAEALADALDLPGPICLRANALRVGRDALAARLAGEGLATRPAARAPDALVVTERRAGIYGLPSWHEALFEVQDEGSQLAGELVLARAGDRVLDLCAGAGGKTLLLAARLADRGELHATDVDDERLARLRVRAARAGVTCLRVHRRDALPAGRFDRVLVDAPCSELGTLRRGPDLRWRIDPASFAALPPLQAALLDEAGERLAPGGRLVYATCTFRAAENDGVADAFERRRPELRRDAELRLWPHRDGTDGFFAVAWVARG